MEFIMMIAFALVIGIVFLMASWSLFIDMSERERLLAVNDVGYMIQDEVILASTVSPGYARTIIIPEKAGRFLYSLNSTQDSVTIACGYLTMTYLLPNITGTFEKGPNLITNGATLHVESP